jgi:4-diphosphocytidyl-2-C-methyl-D-erythritol kinase
MRGDGFHELRTTYQSIALHDEILVVPRPGPFELRSDDPQCPSDRTNLVWRAARHLWRAIGRGGAPDGVLVSIKKRIPVEAGLGGGSSDAAAALRAFAKLWDLDLSADELRTVAGRLGADVPFFLEGGTALGLDRGDLLFPLVDPRRAWVVLVLHRFGISTKDAYAWWDEEATTMAQPQHTVNDLERVVARRHPEISRAVRQLRRAGAFLAAMSGSGSAVYGLFENRSAAESAANGFRGGSRTALVTRTVNRTAFERMTAPSRRAI